jgi:GAF domain-containing protein
VVGAVHDGDVDVHHRVPGAHARGERALHAAAHRVNELAGDGATHGLVFEEEALARLARRDLQHTVAVLTATAGLADEATLGARRARHRLAVGHLRRPVFASTLYSRFMRSTMTSRWSSPMPGDDRLTGLLVVAHAEGRVFLTELLQGLAHLRLVLARLRLDGDRDDRLGEGDRLEQDRVLAVAERVARERVLETDGRGDLAGVDLGRPPRGSRRASSRCGRSARACRGWCSAPGRRTSPRPSRRGRRPAGPRTGRRPP